MSILWAVVMHVVMRGGLHDAQLLQCRDKPAIFRLRPMRLLVDLIGVDAYQNYKNRHPVQKAAKIRNPKNDRAHHQKDPGTVEPRVLREIPTVVMMEDIWLGD
jgi:hypothetical protein